MLAIVILPPSIPLWAPLVFGVADQPPEPRFSPAASYLAGSNLALLSGGFAILDEDVFFEIGAEWRLPKATWGLIPIIGLTAFEGGSYYTYAGLRYEFELPNQFYLAPSLAGGIYDDDSTYNLGGPIEFRSALEFGWHATDWFDVGLTFYHLSNASLYDSNRGSESLVLSLGIDVLGFWR